MMTNEVFEIPIKEILEELEERLRFIEEHYGHFSNLAERRFSNEKLLQVEILNIISRTKGIDDYLPEHLYPNQSEKDKKARKADIWFRHNNAEH